MGREGAKEELGGPKGIRRLAMFLSASACTSRSGLCSAGLLSL